jgi:hypothetical protein
MFNRIICPDPAYEQLEKSGLTKVILDKKRIISDELISSCYDDKIISRAKSSLRKNRFRAKNEKIMIAEDLVELGFDCDNKNIFTSWDYKNLLEKHPAYLSHLILGYNVLRYREFGFSDRRSLEKAITSFCLGESHEFYSGNDEWVWRANGRKNIINRNIHGDLSVSQSDSSGKDYMDKTLFGTSRVFDCMKEEDSLGFGAYQEWSEFLTSLLQYSKKVGLDGINEIVNWKETLEKIGGRGGDWAESFGSRSNCEFSAKILMDYQFMCDGDVMRKFPLTIPNRNMHTVPIFRDEKLLYVKEDEDGNVVLNGKYFEGKKFSKVVEYNAEDLPQAMRGCLKYFARSREMIPAIMNEFMKK